MTKVNSELHFILDQIKRDLNFGQLAVTPMATPLTIGFYEKWLAQNSYGDMKYLQDHLPFKKKPQNLNSHIQSVISVTQPYFPLIKPAPKDFPTSKARVALYAQNEDYHYWLKEKLQSAIQILDQTYPNEFFLPFVDSGPVLERNWAYQNGLGWFGKNSCLIHPKKGSLFFIAEILTSLPADDVHFEPIPDHCGKCTRCVDICPTSAIQDDRTLKADRCISYLTIESRKIPDEEIRTKIADWFFGCDLCQTICPWNQKVFKPYLSEKSFKTDPILTLTETEKLELIDFFRFLLTSSHKKIQKRFLGSPLSRAGGKGLIRNALVVIGNRKLIELKPEVASFCQHEYFHELAKWTLAQLNTIN